MHDLGLMQIQARDAEEHMQDMQMRVARLPLFHTVTSENFPVRQSRGFRQSSMGYRMKWDVKDEFPPECKHRAGDLATVADDRPREEHFLSSRGVMSRDENVVLGEDSVVVHDSVHEVGYLVSVASTE